jgi:hypothetical protein
MAGGAEGAGGAGGKVSDLPDAVFTDLLKQALEQQESKLKLSGEEQQNLLRAMDKPEFTSLMKEYMDEISDPRHRAEQEAYLRQLEANNQVPAHMRLVTPKAGFCIKTRRVEKGAAAGKLFINVCVLDELDKPSVQQTPRGPSWQLPFSLGPMRHERDRAGESHPTFDFALHSEAHQLCRNAAFQKMVVDTALDNVEQRIEHVMGAGVKLNKAEARVLRGVAAMGGSPAVMQIGSQVPSATGSAAAGAAAAAVAAGSATSAAATAAGAAAAGAALTAAGHGQPVTAASPSPASKSNEPQTVAPQYTIAHREMPKVSDSVNDPSLGERVLSRRPKELVVRIKVPKCDNVQALSVQTVGDAYLEVRSDAPEAGNYYAKIALPYPIVDKDRGARWDKKSRTLEVVLDVVQAAPMPLKLAGVDAPRSGLIQEVVATAPAPLASAVGQQSPGPVPVPAPAPLLATQAPEPAPESASYLLPAPTQDEPGLVTPQVPAEQVSPGEPETDEMSEMEKLLALAREAAKRPFPKAEELQPAAPATMSAPASTTTPASTPAPTPAPLALAVAQPDDGVDTAERHAATDAPFIRASGFEGHRPGYFFSTCASGTGYYKETAASSGMVKSAVPPAVESVAAATASPKEALVVGSNNPVPARAAGRFELRSKAIFELD